MTITSSEGALLDTSVCGQGFYKNGRLNCFNYKGWGEEKQMKKKIT